MTKPANNLTFSKSKSLVVLEYILLAVCLSVIALRSTMTEGPFMQSATLPVNFGDMLYTLSLSTVLIFSFVLWLVCSFCSKRFIYRFGGIEIGLCFFCIAAIIAGFAASNKRLAITNFATLLAPVIMAILLVQILDSYSKIKLLFCVIAALAIVSAHQSAEQYFSSNQMTIEQYQQNPQSILEPLGIKPGTFAQFFFEHRLYTKDVRGFFTTSNSAGSFALLALFAAIALFIEKLKTQNIQLSAHVEVSKLSLILCGIAVAVIIFALIITRSKGAIISVLFAAAIFTTFLCFGNWLKAHKKTIMIACLLLFIIGVFIVTWYGLTYGRLPGGNSMLVRWQYWDASAKMFAKFPHYLTGVGPGNFAIFYPHYKPAEALETVADPHNFLLSILTQYGPLGLVGFLAMILIPLWRTTPSPSIEKRPFIQANQQLSFRALAIIYLTIVSIALLLIRPMIIRTPIGDTIEVMLYLIFTFYIVPVAVFVIGFLLLTVPSNTTQATGHEPRVASIAITALISAILGVLLHNLIDFAIFEPSVLAIFWAVIAALIALNFQQKSSTQFAPKTKAVIKILLVAVAAFTIISYLNYVFIPVAKSTAKILQGHRFASSGHFQQAHELLAVATEDDQLDPTAPSIAGQLYLQQNETAHKEQPDLLKNAEKCFVQAIARDKANFKNYEKLSTVYELLDQPQNAYIWALEAERRYPGSDRIQFKLAELAEKLNKIDAAILHYKKAIDIENSFCKQFQQMYPDREIISRLGEDKYKSAKNRLESLSKQTPP